MHQGFSSLEKCALIHKKVSFPGIYAFPLLMYAPALELINWTCAFRFSLARIQNVGKWNFSLETNNTSISEQLGLSKPHCFMKTINNGFILKDSICRTPKTRGDRQIAPYTTYPPHTLIHMLKPHLMEASTYSTRFLTNYYQRKTKLVGRRSRAPCFRNGKKNTPIRISQAWLNLSPQLTYKYTLGINCFRVRLLRPSVLSNQTYKLKCFVFVFPNDCQLS